MADLDKVPGMRKNGPKPLDETEVKELSGDQLIKALNEELRAWQAAGLNPGGVQHDMFAMDVQITTVVNTFIDLGLVTKDAFNEAYRRRFLEKLQDLRSNITKQQITQGITPPNSGIIIAR